MNTLTPFKTLTLVSLITLTCVTTLHAQPKKVYQPVGAPADPKVQAKWNRFHDHAAITKLLKALAAAHPKRCKLKSLGKSHGGRDMWLITITNFDTAKDTDKPAFWIDGGIHANELQAVEVCLYTAWYLLEMDGRSPFVTRLLKERTFYILPDLSPDSREAHFYKPNTTHSPRSGQIPVDDDRDGLINEDPPDDLDKDGHITMMRIKDVNGRYKPHPQYPQMLVPIKEGEKGQYTILGYEGVDNDGDGRVNEDGDGYYDPNRDWAWQWQPRYVQRGAHHYPFSVKENRMAADFILAHPNIAGGQSYHNTGGMLLRGPGTLTDRYDGADLRVYDAIGKKGEMMLPGYRYLHTAKDLYPAYGTTMDWLYAMRGAITYTNELFTSFNYFRDKNVNSETKYKFNKYLLLGDGFVKWHEVNHPQYGKIEVGGFKKNWQRQPPSFLLEEGCHRNMVFTLFHADQMPQVRIQSVTTKKLDGNLRQITAVIENKKLTPSRLGIDVKRKITPPDRVTLKAPNHKVLVAMTSRDPFFKNAKEQTFQMNRVRVSNVPGKGVVYVRWIVDTSKNNPAGNGRGAITVTIQSVKGGADEMSVVAR